METNLIPQAFAALGHPGRLAIFRLLMRFAPQGVRPTEIAEALEMKPNTLSHHLSELEQATLIQVDRQGRSLFYSIRLDQVSALLGYLVHDAGRSRPDIAAALFKPVESDMANHPWNVLFICSGNSARSIFAEAILTDVGKGQFNAYSAGTRPGTQLNPFAIEVLARAGLDVSGLRSKHVSEFEGPDAPKMDFVFTVCDQAATEECAPWPGQPMTAHWGLPDPVKATGTDAEKALAFANVFASLRRRILAFTALPFAELEKVALQGHLDTLGKE
ncbi:MAG: metalloregulator ArsR/SmtB family transcription factor [Cypionkella sp.]|uniref:metalloregulator ArsR/SmtB family transcription factor n=1 Tax=Cypionkella sp. TaxID=2811411 RepID=UPI002AB89987|nr:metalloregulator ArsR/SmtB family transcription factor [Cypionkella sp.]MDZ4309877.1 metalloregulator ArsR/SmtB family transcription factor [Cypionkella sp.]MDZ4395376.1 metalloregulator ArsR/SmtB family transcription factor [Cypionkella sp.]